MARFSSARLFAGYQFLVVIREKELQLGCSDVFSSPFDGTVWIGRAHQDDPDPRVSTTLYEALHDVTHIDVYMFPFGSSRDRSRTTARRLGVRFAMCDWAPLQLDASTSEPAMEWVALRGIRYDGPENVVPEQDPLLLQFLTPS